MKSNFTYHIFVMFFVLLMQGCSAREGYNTLQINQQYECQQPVALSEQEECLAQVNDNYDEYIEKRKEVIDESE
jgi:type IV pilus biogenesis protein CpaD/CtpE